MSLLRTVVVLLAAASLKNVAAKDSFTCAATLPRSQRSTHAQAGNYGNEFLETGVWPDGKVIFKPGGPGAVLADDALEMKFWWWRLVKGKLTIEGHRLNGPSSSPLRAEIPEGYGDISFQATGLIFPTPGCWEITGHVGEHGRLTFVTEVVKIGDGPSWRPIKSDAPTISK